MLKYTSTRQLSIEEFKTPFQIKLDPNNRWVRLSRLIPWDELVEIYARRLSVSFGRPSIDARVVIGALIIQHFHKLSDEELVEQIRENPCLQYFLGYESYSYRQAFDPSLLVSIRKRLGGSALNEMNEIFLSKVEQAEGKRPARPKKQRNSSQTQKTSSNQPADPAQAQSCNEEVSEKQQESFCAPQSSGDEGNSDQTAPEDSIPNQGKLLLDATAACSDIKYPTDLELLNKAREHSERLIDLLWGLQGGKVKPRTYRRKARKEYLSVSRQRKKHRRILRKAVGKQLGYLKRNINIIHQMLDQIDIKHFVLSFADQRLFWIIQELYRQQKQMYDEGSRRIDDRIVSIHQPYVRPILRGRAGSTTEFGPKLSVSLVNGYSYVDRISWNAYNESTDLITQVENFKERFGYYPEAVLADNIYGTRKNRACLKERGIRFSGAALGRRPILTPENAARLKARRKQQRQDANGRNAIEGRFGLAKRGYGLNLIPAKTQITSEAYAASVFFVMNIALAFKACFCAFFMRRLFKFFQIDRLIQTIRPCPNSSDRKMEIIPNGMVCS